MGMLRAALLFSSAFIALALLATPLLDRGTRNTVAARTLPPGLDLTTTGSVRRDEGFVVIRRAQEVRRN